MPRSQPEPRKPDDWQPLDFSLLLPYFATGIGEQQALILHNNKTEVTRASAAPPNPDPGGVNVPEGSSFQIFKTRAVGIPFPMTVRQQPVRTQEIKMTVRTILLPLALTPAARNAVRADLEVKISPADELGITSGKSIAMRMDNSAANQNWRILKTVFWFSLAQAQVYFIEGWVHALTGSWQAYIGPNWIQMSGQAGGRF